ncbi:hypothetical protein GCM10027416_24030 [Okibacterium endophyticum]
MTTILKAPSAADFLALVPQLAGMQPTESIVLVAFRGNRTCGALRVDLPTDAVSAEERETSATTLIGLICKIPRADAVVPVVYSDGGYSPVTGPPHSDYVDMLVARSVASGFLVRDALWVGEDSWSRYGDGDDGPHPIAEVEDSPLHRAIRESGEERELLDIERESSLPAADFESRERTCMRFNRTTAAGVHSSSLSEDRDLAAVDGVPADGVRVGDVLADVVDFAESVLAEEAPADNGSSSRIDNVALVGVLARSPVTRDALLATWAWGVETGDAVCRLNTRYAAGEPIEHDLRAGFLCGLGMPRPDPERIQAAIELMKYAVVRLPRVTHAPLLCMIGWLHWSLGRGSIAGRWVDKACIADPAYPLAHLLATLLATGHLPDWAYETRTESAE